jgi:hypothetical protein
MAEEKETTEQQAEGEDLEVEEEQADEVQGGLLRKSGADKDPQGVRYKPDPQARR